MGFLRSLKFWKRSRKPVNRTGLTFAFRHQGFDYYQYSEQSNIPMFRIARLSELNIWISRGATKQQLLELLTAADDALFNGIANKKNAALIGSILNEIRNRENKAVPIDVWYNYLAACYIRDDEPMDSWDQGIQDEKANTFKDAAKDPDSFFFLLPELKLLTTRSDILPIAWKSICHESMIQQARHRELIEMLRNEVSRPQPSSSSKGKT